MGAIKKMKKLFRDPKMFFNDMMLNKLQNEGYSCYKKYNSEDRDVSNNIIIEKKIVKENIFIENNNMRYRGVIPGDKVSIIIPVYNAYDEFRNCLESVFDNLNEKFFDIIVINDHSTDERVDLFCKSINHKNFHYIYNKENLGYTKSINKAISSCDTDVILLNSDTIVTFRWAENLKISAYSKKEIGTVTAISNNAGIVSFPILKNRNDNIYGFTKEEYATIVTQSCLSIRSFPTVTGVGFCMYIKRSLFNDIGLFDENRFPRGYGEENDFCMRAYRKGWEHIISAKTYVYHIRNASFGEEKTKNIEESKKQLACYPEYSFMARNILNHDNVKSIKKSIEANIKRHKDNNISAKRRILFVISSVTGGTPQTNQDLMDACQAYFECFLLYCDGDILKLYNSNGLKSNPIFAYKLSEPMHISSHRSSEYDEVFAEILFRYSIDLVHLRHIARHSLGLMDVCQQFMVPIVFSLHDYYTVCPSLNLWTNNNVCCFGNCNDNCKIPLWSNDNFLLNKEFVSFWRNRFEKYFEKVDAIISTDISVKENIERIYQKKFDNFYIIPHGRNFKNLYHGHDFSKGDKLKIVIAGNINIAKGGNIIKKLSQKLPECEFHIFGKVNSSLGSFGKNCILYGVYEREDLINKIYKTGAQIGLLTSLWPETYCHTLTEYWASGLPVIAINLGAVGNRIINNNSGWIVEYDEENIMVNKIYDILKNINTKEYINKKEFVLKHQKYLKCNTTEKMSIEYLKIYNNILYTNMKCFNKRIAVIVKNSGIKFKPTSYIRIIQRIRNIIKIQNINNIDTYKIDFIDQYKFLYKNNYDTVITLRDSIQKYIIDDFINICKSKNINIIYDIDDMIFDDKRIIDGYDMEQVFANKKMIESATCVTVSTNMLLNEIRKINSNVKLMNNVVSVDLFSSPSLHKENYEINTKNNILFFGNKDHIKDIVMLNSVADVLKDKDIHIWCTFESDLLSKNIHIIKYSNSSYPLFVDFLKKI